MIAGVLALQGAVSEHISAFLGAMNELGIEGEALAVRTTGELEKADLLAIPGGESTTISRLLDRNGLREPLTRRWKEGMPILGTCAGVIILASEGDESVMRSGTKQLGFLDASVNRNAFGRQRESFEADLTIDGLDGSFRGIFIRGPAIMRNWGECRVRSRLEGVAVMVQQGNVIGTSFHPELSGDLRIHKEVVKMAREIP